MCDDEFNPMKTKKRNFLIVFSLALVPLVMLIGSRLFSILSELVSTIQEGELLPGILAFLLRIFTESILLIIISVFWTAICCYSPLKKLQRFYCENVIPKAILHNADYAYVSYSEKKLDISKLEKAGVIPVNAVIKQNEAEYFLGRYKGIDFEIAPLTLSYGRKLNEKINGTIIIFKGLSRLFSDEQIVHVSCSTNEDLFAENMPKKRGLKVKARMEIDDRTCVITASKNQMLSDEQTAWVQKFVKELSKQVKNPFYVTFSQGKVYFINDEYSIIIKLPLWKSIEKEIQEFEQNGIKNINLFIDTFIGHTDIHNN